ncbi:hypothetical protein BpHYR1_005321 [Brachionus plicatilis]|uniref:Uncharacterized protein n=1 Tax=Brachionus plicatilis TaxID=10195 RepID=A0A3M7QBP0_BRAPC|nr:hypothetical protein BpHYR1_005321 [Brachionus plicatilis]
MQYRLKKIINDKIIRLMHFDFEIFIFSLNNCAELCKENLGCAETIFACVEKFCEVQYKRTEQSFKINSVNAEWCNIQSCINSCKVVLGAVKFFLDRFVAGRSAHGRPFYGLSVGRPPHGRSVSWPATSRSVFILADSWPATSRFSEIWPATSRSVFILADSWPALERSAFLKTVHRRSNKKKELGYINKETSKHPLACCSSDRKPGSGLSATRSLDQKKTNLSNTFENFSLD